MPGPGGIPESTLRKTDRTLSTNVLYLFYHTSRCLARLATSPLSSLPHEVQIWTERKLADVADLLPLEIVYRANIPTEADQAGARGRRQCGGWLMGRPPF